MQFNRVNNKECKSNLRVCDWTTRRLSSFYGVSIFLEGLNVKCGDSSPSLFALLCPSHLSLHCFIRVTGICFLPSTWQLKIYQQ